MKRGYTERPRFEYRIRMDLAMELTGKNEQAIRKLMERKEITLAQAIKYYLDDYRIHKN